MNDKTLINNVLPESLVQFNSSFQKEKSFDDLVQENTDVSQQSVHI